MTFTKRIATLAAVVAIPLGIAATSQILAGGQEKPDVPQRVRLDGGTATPATTTPGTATPSPSATPSPAPSATGGDEVVPGPSPRGGGDDDDDGGDGADD